MAGSSPADLSNVAVTREIATSRDGTRIPLSIRGRRGTRLDGRTPGAALRPDQFAFVLERLGVAVRPIDEA
jgi:hypothetical protein